MAITTSYLKDEIIDTSAKLAKINYVRGCYGEGLGFVKPSFIVIMQSRKAMYVWVLSIKVFLYKDPDEKKNLEKKKPIGPQTKRFF